MKVTTLNQFPPLIIQRFPHDLLSCAYTGFLSDCAQDLYRFYEYIRKKLMKKVRNLPKKKADCDQLTTEFLQIYEKIKVKEEERKKETGHFTQRPFYRFSGSSRNGEKIFRRLKFR